MNFEFSLIFFVVIAALMFDFVNGWNDSANAIATVVSTRVLTPFVAVIFAGVLNFFGALVSTRVAKTIAGGIVNPNLVTSEIVLAAMLAATIWVAVCTWWGLPISGSHSLIGGLVGAAAAAFGWEVLKLHGIMKVLIALVVSPLAGFLGGYALLVIVYWVANAMKPKNGDAHIQRAASAIERVYGFHTRDE